MSSECGRRRRVKREKVMGGRRFRQYHQKSDTAKMEEDYEGGGMMMMIKKGPWKAEEDEVLMKHVNRYGPRDWSSIRSKGLLQRSGKSCRLRWVNKLRPNLKNGVKFSAEEERTVIELQAQFGNRWARIATYLPGRTDNDVKNFWSSRQKRLARLLQTPGQPPSKSHHHHHHHKETEVALLPDGPIYMEVPKLSSSAEKESSSKSQICSSSLINNSQIIKMLPCPDHLVKSNSLNCEQNHLQLDFNPVEKNPTHGPQLHLLPFPPIPDLLPDFPPKEEFDNLSFFDIFGKVEAPDYGDIAQFPFAPSCFGSDGDCRSCFTGENESPDSIFDDFPTDMFDQIEPFSSPPE